MRPSKISGCPVNSEISVVSMPESLSLEAVPPVEIISHPRECSTSARSSIPVLSQTLISALGRLMMMRTCERLEGSRSSIRLLQK